MSNDLTKKDREREAELVTLKKSKNESEVGPWKYLIRGPPGDRRIIKIPKRD